MKSSATRRASILSLLIVASFAALPAHAKDIPLQPSAAPVQQEKIGLVLSGGGARGLAHIGVIKALEAQHIPIDFITGTSAGALIGGMYASGMSISEIENKIKSMDLGDIAFAKAERREQTQVTRNLDYKGSTIADISITNSGAVAFPQSVSNGTKAEEVLRDLLKDHPYDADFDKLPIPFRAVAADLATGKAVVLKNGQLAQALRASMSIPAVFPPVEMNGRLLVDGMIDRNMPVDVAKQMGATRIIAVDVGSGLVPKDRLNSVLGVSEQMLALLVQRNMDEQIALLSSKDILIRPQMGDIGSLEFNRGMEAAQAGFNTTQTMTKQLASFAVPNDVYQNLMAKHQPQVMPAVKVDFIRVQTNGLASPASLRTQIQMQEGQNFDLNTVNQDIARIMSSGRISNVAYEVQKLGEHNELVYFVKEKDIAQNAVRAGIEVVSNGLSDQQFSLNLSHRRVWLNSLGGEWRSHATIGKTTSFDTQLNQPLSHADTVFVRPYAKVSNEKRPAYLNGSQVSTEYTTHHQTYGILFGTPINRIGEWGLGLSYRRASLSGNISALQAGAATKMAHTTVDAQLTIDQLDDVYIPTSGYFFKAFAHVSPTKADNEKRYVQAGVLGLYAKRFNNHSIAFSMEATGQSSDTSPYLSPFGLGGYQHLSGYAQNQFVGNRTLFGSLTYRFNTPWRVLNNPLIVGASLESGAVWANEPLENSGLKYSGSLFGALQTPIGPAQLGFSLTRQGNARLYFYLGKTFTENSY
ncbi:patatin-like phospholipase family protein [Hydromonas duriensis]|uniref:NTE family protein n=1 Tax=Hydromonas duriensis TaxID=1527608 RepID=A0A4R6Y8U6_9BURK|nr:patatin-like phospholipase family protein [Hydromonas duriensis]TDR31842.1 NTE family protein [Hydromonas duriensis]